MDGSFDPNDKRWRGGAFRPSSSRLIVILVVTVFLGYVGVMILIERQDFYQPPLRVENLFGLIPLLSLLTLFCFIKAALRRWRFRGSRFTMDSMPGVIGGRFTGVLVLPDLFERDTKIRVEIVNEKEVRRRSSGKSNNISTERFYFDFKNLMTSQGKYDGRFIRLPVEFTIPYDTKDESFNGKESSKRGDVKVKYRWVVKAKAVIRGADLDIAFEVPVYRTSESDPSVIEEAKDTDDLKREIDRDGGPKRVEVFQEMGYKRYVLKAWPGFISIITPLIACIIFSAAGIFLMFAGIKGFYEYANGAVESVFKAVGGCGMMLFSLPFLGVGFLMVIILMQSLSRKETWVDFGYLHHSGKFLFYSWKKKIELGRVQDVVFEKAGSSENVDIYRVVVKHVVDLPKFATNQNMRNKSLYVADGITSKAEAMWLKEELLEAVIEKV